MRPFSDIEEEKSLDHFNIDIESAARDKNSHQGFENVLSENYDIGNNLPTYDLSSPVPSDNNNHSNELTRGRHG
ncbi:hypothetical protein ABEB36_014174 [Hypothenemus hampei]|uniref:Uncharacterized protein n=1 Tax=Hypothenemus hampei TaxID=57062 RepID=A0ABD1E4E8_HYPHA